MRQNLPFREFKAKKNKAAEEMNLSPAHISGRPTRSSEPFVAVTHIVKRASCWLHIT